MIKELMYIELKFGYSDDGPAQLAEKLFSTSCGGFKKGS